MECGDVKGIIADYIAHRLPAEKVSDLEAHLCVCEQCRAFLSDRLDLNEIEAERPLPLAEEPVAAYELVQEPVQESSPLFDYFAVAVAALAVLFILALFFKSRSLGIQ